MHRSLEIGTPADEEPRNLEHDMKKIMMIAVLMLTSQAASAQFGSSYSSFGSSFGGGQTDSCGPSVSAGYTDNQSAGGGGYGASGGTTYQANITWQIGRKKACEANNRNRLRQSRAQAKMAEINELNQRIELCSQFSPMSAPQTMVNFCGDLLGVQTNQEPGAAGYGAHTTSRTSVYSVDGN